MNSSPSPAPGAPRSALIIAFSVLNLLVAATLLSWVLGHRSAGVSSQTTTPQPTVISVSVSPTSVVAILPQATFTPLLILYTDTPVPPPPSTDTSQLPTPASTPPPLPTETPVLPTLTAAALPFTGTPPPVPSPSQALPLPTETPAPPVPPTAAPAEVPTATAVPPTARRYSVIVDVPYYVQSGDTLSRLAVRFHTTVSAIMRRNGLSSARIYTGQYLIIPDP